MYRIQRDISNTTAAYRNLASLVTANISNTERGLLQNAIDFVLRYLQLGLRWIARQSRQAISTLWRALRIAELLHSIQLILLRILKICGIAFAVVIGGTIIMRIAYWGLPKLFDIYHERRTRRLQERLENEYAARQRQLRATRAAEAAAKEEARLRQARETQALEDEVKRDNERKQRETRAVYKSWKQDCDVAFRNRASMTEFPFPPLPRCTNPRCRAYLLKTPVPACEHNVRQFFRESGEFSFEVLKFQRNLWHEDRFKACREDLRKEFGRLANSLFVVLDPWYEEVKAKKGGSSSGG